MEARSRMNSCKGNNLLSALALVFSAGWGVAWVAGLLVDGGEWSARLGTLVVGLILAGASAALLLGRVRSERQALARHLEILTRIDPMDLRGETADSEFPPLGAGHPLHELANRARASLVQICERLQDLDHSRNAWEIRCHRLSIEHDRIKAILTALDDPILVIDQYDELLLANSSAESLLGFDIESTDDRELGSLIHCQTLIDLLTTTCHRQSADSRSDEMEIVHPEGETGWYRVTAKKLGGEDEASAQDDSNAGAVAVLRDIGEKKILQRRNAEFVSSVSHEMKTPLAGIKAYVELLADGEAEDKETQEEFLGVIATQADRLQRLVENLLNLARMEAGVVKVDKHSRPLNEVLEEALRVVRPSAEAKRIDLIADLSPMYLGLLADRDMLLQAAINLLSNAIKYTPEEGRVTLRSRMIDTDVRFEVEDTGVGLSEEDARRVFEKFYRVKKNKDMAAGTGLGLPLARHIVEDVHGGTVSVQSAPGEGSTFAVTIPGSKQLSMATDRNRSGA